MVGYLNQSLYGTCDAATIFQKEVMKFVERIGFTTGRYDPCTFFHKEGKLRTLAHRDAFAAARSREQCSWMK